MNLKTLCYAKKTNTQKSQYYKILSVRNIRSRQIHRDRQDVEVVQVVVGKVELWKNWLMGKMFYFEVIEMFGFKRKEYIFCTKQKHITEKTEGSILI